MAFKTRGNDPFSRVSYDLEAKNAEIEEAFNALGKAYFKAHESDAEDKFKPFIETIGAAQKKSKIYAELLVRMQGVRICPKCGAEITSDSAFCNLCGTKITEPEPLCDGENVYCNACGSPMPIGQKFCSACGTTLPVIDGAKAPEAPAPEAPVEEAAPAGPAPEAPAEEPAPEEVAPEAPAEEPAPEAPAEEPVPEEVAPEAPAEEPASQSCPACGKVLPLGVRFCTGCGQDLSAPVQSKCPNCGKVLSPEAIFCTGCGIRVK